VSPKNRPVREDHERRTDLTRRRYDRVAPVYDLMESFLERRFRAWRRELWRRVDAGTRVLEVGVGTGKNLAVHPFESIVTGIDLSPKMLARAQRRARRLGSQTRLELADVQALPFADGSFDVVVATFVFCSVPDPARGLQEVRRVLRPDGRLLLLEHVLSERRALRAVMRLFDPLTVRISGAHIARETVLNVRAAGFDDLRVADLSLDVVKRIEARASADLRFESAEATKCRGGDAEVDE